MSLVFRRNNYQHTSFINSANGISGYFFRKYANIQYYFHLRAVNDSLVTQNARLLNQLPEDFMAPDTATMRYPGAERLYQYLPARVVNNSVNSQMNYLTLYRGTAEGVSEGMGVMGPQGVVGIVRKASAHYAVVMSVLHKDMRISAKLVHTGNFGSVTWDVAHPDPHYAVLSDIPKNVTLHLGDSVVTSGYSAIFPPGLLIGFVDRVSELAASNFHRVRIRLATHFQTLQYVYVIKNFNAEEQHQLESTMPHE